MAIPDESEVGAGGPTGSWPPAELTATLRGRVGSHAFGDLLSRVGGVSPERALAALYVGGCSVGLVGAATMEGPERFSFLALLISGYAFGAVMLSVRSTGRWIEHAAILYANLAIVEANVLIGTGDAPFLALFMWTSLYSSWFFSRRGALAHAALTGGGVLVSVWMAPGVEALSAVVAIATLTLVCMVSRLSSERIQLLLDRLELRSRTDALTRVANRHAFDELTRQLAHRPTTDVASILSIDVDRFKSVNDVMGHAVGDQILQKVAGAILTAIRQTDLVYRLGGDEFVVFLPGAGRGAATRVARDIQTALAEADTPCPVTVSVGIATGTTREVGEMLRRSDERLYEVKRSGGAGVGGAS